MAGNEPAEEDSAANRALAWLRALSRTPANAHEAVALAVHALLLGHGFRDADVADSDSTAPTLRADWGQGGYGGRYRHTRSSLTFEVRSTPLGARLRVTGVHDATDTDAATLDLPIAAYYVAPEAADANWTTGLRALEQAATLVLVQIAHRLVPDAAKEGYEQGSAPLGGTSAGGGGSAADAQRPRPMPPHPGYPVPRPDIPAYGDDPLRIGPVRGPRQPGYPAFPGMPGMPGLPGAEPDAPFGRDDLMPHLPRGPLFGGTPGGNLMGPNNFPGMIPRGDGRGIGPNPGGIGGGRGAGRGGVYPGPVPPGARYDPMGPGGVGPDNNIERPPDDDPPAGMYW